MSKSAGGTSNPTQASGGRCRTLLSRTVRSAHLHGIPSRLRAPFLPALVNAGSATMRGRLTHCLIFDLISHLITHRPRRRGAWRVH